MLGLQAAVVLGLELQVEGGCEKYVKQISFLLYFGLNSFVFAY